MATIPVPARFIPDGIAAWIETWSTLRDAPDVRLVLPANAHLEPSSIALLAAGIARRRALGMRTWMFADGCANGSFGLLQGLEFFHELGVDTEPDARRVPERAVVPLRRIANLSVARNRADATRASLESLAPSIPPSTVRAAQFVFEELAANIVQHSGATQTGFGVAMADPVSKRIQIAFADAGVGFRASLASSPESTGRIADDGEAIRAALEKRSGHDRSDNIGMGLFLLSAFADRVKGILWIATGDALFVRRDADSRNGEGVGRVEKIERTAGWRGAFLCLDAPVPGW